MSNNTLRTKIVDRNASYLGVEIKDLMETAGENIAQELIKKYGKEVDYAFICGLGNNGGNGFAAARHLAEQGVTGEINVYLIGRQNNISQAAAEYHWQLLKESTSNNLHTHNAASAEDVENHQVIVECLVGTGMHGELKKRYRDVIKRATHFRQAMVALDVPVPGYTWDLSLSNMYPKTEDAVVIDIGMPQAAEVYVGPGEVEALWKQKSHSYKSQNGKLLIFVHDAVPQLPEAAEDYLGAINVFNFGEQDLQTSWQQVTKSKLHQALFQADAIFLASSLLTDFATVAVLKEVAATSEVPLIVSGELINSLDLDVLKDRDNFLLAPERTQLRDLLGETGTIAGLEGKMKRFAAEHNGYVLVSGYQDMLFGDSMFTGYPEMRLNSREVMQATQEDMAALTAAYATKNHLQLAAAAAMFVLTH